MRKKRQKQPDLTFEQFTHPNSLGHTEDPFSPVRIMRPRLGEHDTQLTLSTEECDSVMDFTFLPTSQHNFSQEDQLLLAEVTEDQLLAIITTESNWDDYNTESILSSNGGDNYSSQQLFTPESPLPKLKQKPKYNSSMVDSSRESDNEETEVFPPFFKFDDSDEMQRQKAVIETEKEVTVPPYFIDGPVPYKYLLLETTSHNDLQSKQSDNGVDLANLFNNDSMSPSTGLNIDTSSDQPTASATAPQISPTEKNTGNKRKRKDSPLEEPSKKRTKLNIINENQPQPRPPQKRTVNRNNLLYRSPTPVNRQQNKENIGHQEDRYLEPK